MKKINKLLILLMIPLLAFSGCKNAAEPGQEGEQNDMVSFPGPSSFKCVKYGDQIYYDGWVNNSYQLMQISASAGSMYEAKPVKKRKGVSINQLYEHYLIVSDDYNIFYILDAENNLKQTAEIKDVASLTAIATDGYMYYLSTDTGFKRFSFKSGKTEKLADGPFLDLVKGEGRLLLVDRLSPNSIFAFDLSTLTLTKLLNLPEGYDYNGGLAETKDHIFYSVYSEELRGINWSGLYAANSDGSGGKMLFDAYGLYGRAAVDDKFYVCYVPDTDGQKTIAIVDSDLNVTQKDAKMDEHYSYDAYRLKESNGVKLLYSISPIKSYAITAAGPQYTLDYGDMSDGYSDGECAVFLRHYPHSIFVMDLKDGSVKEIAAAADGTDEYYIY